MDYDPLNNFETLLYGTPVDPLVCTPLSEYNSELEDAYRFRSPSSSSSSSSSSLVVSPTTNAGPRPDLPGSIPALVLHKAVAAGLTRAGFDEADPDALDELEGALASCQSSFSSLPRLWRLTMHGRTQSLVRYCSTRTSWRNMLEGMSRPSSTS
jgi:hypothetical protein